MLRIRLRREGGKHDPHFRVVVTDRRAGRDGPFVEVLGHYHPAKRAGRLQLDVARAEEWIGKGARPSSTVRRLMKLARTMPEPSAEEAPTPAKPAAKSEPATEAEAAVAVEAATETEVAAETDVADVVEAPAEAEAVAEDAKTADADPGASETEAESETGSEESDK